MMDMKTLTFLILGWALAHEAKALPACHASARLISKKPVEVHGSTLVETPAGIRAAWFQGGEHNPQSFIASSVFDGKTWGPISSIADGSEFTPRLPVWNPVLYRNNDGTLELFYKLGNSPDTWFARERLSRDDGASWEAPRRLDADPAILGPIRAKATILSDGTLLAGSSTESPIWKIHLEARSPEGVWKRLDAFQNDPENHELIQPIILAFPQGELHLLARSRRKHIFESQSHDNGQTWSPLKASALPNPSSGIDGLVLNDGSALLVFNDATSGRGNLTLARRQVGTSWKRLCTLENGLPFLEYSYPAIIQAQDGRIHISYTHNRRWIKHVVLKP